MLVFRTTAAASSSIAATFCRAATRAPCPRPAGSSGVVLNAAAVAAAAAMTPLLLEGVQLRGNDALQLLRLLKNFVRLFTHSMVSTTDG